MLLLGFSVASSAQQHFSSLSDPEPSYLSEDPKPKKDSLTPDQKRAKRIAIQSAVLPGWGQFSNKKYWKIPIIYAGAVGLGLVIDYNHGLYKEYKKSLLIRLNNDTTSIDPRPDLSDNAVIAGRDVYRRGRDFAIIISAVVYLLNIADAYVDAHLSTFDVSDDLSLGLGQPLQPNLGNIAPPSQLTVSLKIKLGK